jgi:hypothetical protein
MSKGIILGGAIERSDTSETRNQAPGLSTPEPPATWHSIKRSAGAHRIATHLREKGWDIEVVDFWPAWTREELLQFMEQRVDKDTTFIGISSMFPLQGPGGNDMVQYMNETLQEVKRQHPHLVLIGGSQNVSASLQWWCDYYIAGFAEVGIIELLEHIKGNAPEPRGLEVKNVWGMDRKIINCRHHYPAFPWPDARVQYEARDFMRPDDIPTLEFSRGCKFKCRFCSFSVLGVKGDYSREEEGLYEELLHNYENWGITTYSVSDETINDDDEKLAKLARVAKRLPFQPSFQGFMRADLLVSKPHTWQDAWDAGIRSHLYGVETLNHTAGKFVGKGMNPDRLKEGLLRVQDWFRDKGYYRATVSTIIGLPGETEDSFLEGRDWILNNLKGHSYSFFPLFIGQNETMQLMTNPSVLEQEWAARKNDSPLWETDKDEMGVDYEELDPSLQPVAQFYMEAPGVAKWAHKDMNIWQAFQLFNKIAKEPLLPTHIAPGIFFYHRYVTGGDYTVEDMQNTFLSDDVFKSGKKLTVDDYNIDPALTKTFPKQMQIIEDYKKKKLAWQ